MNVIPAQVAGVGQIAVASPPGTGRGGLPHPAVLAACALLGITEVHAVGGAQAIAMFAYGTADCAAADIVSGPGNVYVAAAKRLLRGTVGTDAEAGPTEIAILADHTARADFVAADLVAQAEHDPLAACLLVTSDPELADRVDAELAGQVRAARHADRIAAALAGQSACVLVDDLDAGLAVVDAWAPEHLEIQATGADEPGRPGPQRRGGVRRAMGAGLARRLPRRIQPRAADRRDRPQLRRPVGAVLPARSCTWSTAPRPAWRRSRRTSTRSAGPRTWPRT